MIDLESGTAGVGAHSNVVAVSSRLHLLFIRHFHSHCELSRFRVHFIFPIQAMFPTKDAYDVMVEQSSAGSRWANFITSQTQLHMLSFEAQGMIHRVSPTPLLFVIPGNDVLVSTKSQMDAFNKAREPKQLHYLEGCGHFDVYLGDFFCNNIKVQLEFLERHVK